MNGFPSGAKTGWIERRNIVLNSITIQGRCVRPIELRYTQAQKPVASFTIAVERDFAQTGEKREADFVDCVAFGNTATFCDKYMEKGGMYIVTGRLQSREWTDKNDNKRVSWEVIADHVYFGESKKNAKPVDVDAPQSSFSELADTDGDLPF